MADAVRLGEREVHDVPVVAAEQPLAQLGSPLDPVEQVLEQLLEGGGVAVAHHVVATIDGMVADAVDLVEEGRRVRSRGPRAVMVAPVGDVEAMGPRPR